MAYGKRITRRRRTFSQKKDIIIFRSGLVVLVALLLLFLLIFLSRIERIQINELVVSGNSVTSSKDIERVFKENTAGFYFKMFSKTNSLIFPKSEIRDDLMNEFQRLEEVKLSVKDFQKLYIDVEEREPDILWCGEEFSVATEGGDANTPEKCYFIDAGALIYSRAPNFSGNVFLRVYSDIGEGDPIGKSFMTVSKYQSLKFFKSAVEQLGLTPNVVAKLSDNDLEMYFEEGGKLIYNSDQDMVRLADDLGSILKDPEFKKGIENGEFNLDYIDLRLGNKVYYRFK